MTMDGTESQRSEIEMKETKTMKNGLQRKKAVRNTKTTMWIIKRSPVNTGTKNPNILHPQPTLRRAKEVEVISRPEEVRLIEAGSTASGGISHANQAIGTPVSNEAPMREAESEHNKYKRDREVDDDFRSKRGRGGGRGGFREGGDREDRGPARGGYRGGDREERGYGRGGRDGDREERGYGRGGYRDGDKDDRKGYGRGGGRGGRDRDRERDRGGDFKVVEF